MITILKISGRFNEIKKDMMSLKISSLWKCRGGDKNEVQSHYTVNEPEG